MSAVQVNFAKVCCGLEGAEGPVFDTKGNFYVVTPMENSTAEDGPRRFEDGIAGKLCKINLKTGEKTVACTPWSENFGGRPAGCQSDKEDNIWIADMRLGILKYSPTNGCKQLSKVDADGRALNGCNDLVFDTNGNLWITGPGSPIAPNAEDRQEIFKVASGCLYFLRKGESVPIRIPNQAFRFCNGIAFRDDLLLVAETMTQSIIAFDVISSGKIQNRREWAKLPIADYDNPLKIGGPDGMDFDSRGRLLVAHHGGSHIEVFSQEGKLEARIQCPFKQPSNLHFLPGSKTCYVTEHDENSLWKFEWECEGMPMYSDL